MALPAGPLGLAVTMAAASVVRAIGSNLAQHLKEIRIHLCQHSAASQGARIQIQSKVTLDQLLCSLSVQSTSRVAVVGKHRREQCVPRLELLYRRDFIEQHYVTLKKANPNFPIFIRECSNVHPMLWARYAFGLEKSVSLNNLNVEQVAKALENAVNSKI